jgi:phosphoserine phosphatase RsbU/P
MAGTIPVLLVEDNAGDARLIQMLLAESGQGRFELRRTERLAGALRLMDEREFDAVLLDLSLPDSQGLETFRRLRAHAPGVPVVVLTGLDDETAAVQAVQDGAQDYLVKGQVAGGRQLVHSLRYAVGRHQRQRVLEDTLRATKEELSVARRIQEQLFPAAAPTCPGFDIHGAAFCAGDVGGDFFDFLRMPDGRVGVVIGDVTGHGIGPALLMAATRAYLRAFAQTQPEVGPILALANRVLAEDLAEGRNVTLFLAQLEPRARTLRHSSAGHPPGYVLDATGAVRARLYSTGLPLGIQPDGDFAAEPALTLHRGDVVVLFTDGLVEARCPAEKVFGQDRVLDVVRASRSGSARDVVGALHQAVRDFSGDQPQRDDITVIVIKAVEDAPAGCANG